QIWVKVPVITGGSVSDSIWLYYKNQNASDGQNPAGVWSSGYAAVYHLNGNGKDARAVHNGTESTVADQDPGKIARARNFDGSISYIDIGSPSGVDDVFNGGGTLSAWIYPTGWGENNYGRILDKRIIETGGIGWSFLLNNNGPLACLSFSHGFDSGTNSKVWSSPASSITLNLWHHVAVVYDKTSAPILYINGIAQSLSATGSGTSADSDAAQNLVMGNHSRSPAGLGAFTTRTFDGHLDEVRISNVSRSADWMIAHNRTVNGMFHFFNAEENLQDILNRELPIFIYLNM
ncbi:MAG: hypothetical protein OEZ34_11245, partial [Spirochaetia bacterium]|nr:hypothetical protein [Spirochaetia bacterium]